MFHCKILTSFCHKILLAFQGKLFVIQPIAANMMDICKSNKNMAFNGSVCHTCPGGSKLDMPPLDSSTTASLSLYYSETRLLTNSVVKEHSVITNRF